MDCPDRGRDVQHPLVLNPASRGFSYHGVSLVVPQDLLESLQGFPGMSHLPNSCFGR